MPKMVSLQSKVNRAFTDSEIKQHRVGNCKMIVQKKNRDKLIASAILSGTFKITSSKQMAVIAEFFFKLLNVNALRAIFFLWIFFIDIKVLRTNLSDPMRLNSILLFTLEHYFAL